MRLTMSHKRLLLKIAGDSIASAVRTERSPAVPPDLTVPALQLKCGVFVSVYVDGRLRGCLGTFSEEEPLWQNVQRLAASAATADTRFSPLMPEELGSMRIEISVLSPRKRITDIREIKLGKHGIYLQKGLNRGTFLPQVAPSQQWDVYEFLGNCAKYKAGIGWEGWKTAEIYIFEAIIFNSED